MTYRCAVVKASVAVRGTPQAIVDRQTETLMRDWRDSDTRAIVRVGAVEQVEQARGGFGEVAGR